MFELFPARELVIELHGPHISCVGAFVCVERLRRFWRDRGHIPLGILTQV